MFIFAPGSSASNYKYGYLISKLYQPQPVDTIVPGFSLVYANLAVAPMSLDTIQNNSLELLSITVVDEFRFVAHDQPNEDTIQNNSLELLSISIVDEFRFVAHDQPNEDTIQNNSLELLSISIVTE